MLQYIKTWSKPLSACDSMSFCAIINKDFMEGLGDMNLVGMFVSPEGIFSFGDSKATKRDEFGNMYEDIKRGNIDKIFSNEHYVLGYTGNNDMMYQGEETFLEDFFHDYIAKYSSWNDLMEYLLSVLTKNNYPENYEIHFLIGEKNNHSIGYHDKYQLHQIIMKNHYMILHPRIVSTLSCSYLLTIGNEFYTKEIGENFPVSRNLQQMEASIASIGNLIKEMDERTPYNPVGLPLKTILFQ